MRGPFQLCAKRSRQPPNAILREHWVVAREKIGHGTTWTTEDKRQLRAHSQARTPLPVIAKKMKRTERALRRKARILGIGLGHRRPRSSAANPAPAEPFASDLVLPPLSSVRHGLPMLDADKLTPADPREVETCLSLGLTSGSRRARHQAAGVMAKVVAERLVMHLEQSGFVIMREPTPVGGAGDPAPRLPDNKGAAFQAALRPGRA
jgi:hypothetical protein